MTDFCTDPTVATFDVLKVNDGAYNPNNPGLEANNNIQYASAMAYPTPHTFYSLGGDAGWSLETGKPADGDLYLEWYNFLHA